MKNIFLLLTLLALCNAAMAEGKPLRVFILAGQSNMQGHANVRTLDYIGKDPKTAPMLRQILGPDGKPRTSDHVWITYLSENQKGPTEKNGRLTTGFGANDECIGPELTFGLTMEQQIGGPILLIKTAWGGKSLHTDFRPPSAGPYELTESDVQRLKSRGKDIAAEKAARAQASGVYYRRMIEQVRKVLADPKKYCPEYDAKLGYELSGFAWLQGWNDLVDTGVYPNRDKAGGYDLYSRLLAQFIREVRGDLKAPQLPFAIGVLGVGGTPDLAHPDRTTHAHRNFRDAMAAPAKLPEFKGRVVNVMTEIYWDPLQDSADKKRSQLKDQIQKMKKEGRKFGPGEEESLFQKMMTEACTPAEWEAFNGMSNQAYHYLGSAKILGGIGKGFAEALGPLAKKR